MRRNIFLVVFLIAIVLFLKPFPDGVSPSLTTTTVLATLLTLLTGLLTLAITAYIFLAGSLKGRQERYERETVDKMLERYTCKLLVLSVAGIIMLSLCFLLDNADPEKDLPQLVQDIMVVLSFIECIFLLIYTCFIIRYETCLVNFSKRLRKELFPPGGSSIAPKQVSLVFKRIGDLEMLAEQLVRNHKDGFHEPGDLDTLRGLVSDNLVGSYQRLISYRNYLWVEQQQGKCAAVLTEREFQRIFSEISPLENAFRSRLLKGERLTDLSFSAPFLSQNRVPFYLQGTTFRGSAFEQEPESGMGIDFSSAILINTDFSDARLNYIDLSGADCTGAVFSGASFCQLKVTAQTQFRNAVFRNVDFGSQRFCPNGIGSFQFQNASFVDANMIDCVFRRCNFHYANFERALLSNATLDSVFLSRANLSRSVLTHTRLFFQHQTAHVFSEQTRTTFWRDRHLGAALYINLERSTLTDAYLGSYDFTGSRMYSANFSYAKIEFCLFDRCYGQKATFLETIVQSCRFSYAMFNQVDLSYAHIRDCDFSNSDLRDSLMVQVNADGVSLERSRFYRANFTNAQVRGCLFQNCDFTEALFESADLRDSIFVGCSFKDASFIDADLHRAVFKQCDLDGADFGSIDPMIYKKINC